MAEAGVAFLALVTPGRIRALIDNVTVCSVLMTCTGTLAVMRPNLRELEIL